MRPEGALKSTPWRQVVDVNGTWTKVMALPPGAALLVRPDGHVAAHLVLAAGHGAQEKDAAAVTSLTNAVRGIMFL
eukprot:gene22738-29903_t